MNKHQLKKRIESITNLPTLPQVATHLLSIINDPVTSCSEVAFIVGQDVSLSARILRLANSAFYGMPKTVTTVKKAVVILGLKVINTLVLTLTVFDMFPQDRDHKLFDRKAFWRHSLACALLAKKLASSIDAMLLVDAEEAFCCGLLHDIGKVVMEQYLHDDFRSALSYAKEQHLPIVEAEKKALGYTHVDIAEWLTGNWQLPEVLRNAILHHHEPGRGGKTQPDMAHLCAYSDYLSYEAGYPSMLEVPAPGLDPAVRTIMNIFQEAVKGVTEKLADDLAEIETHFGITPD